MTRRRRRKKNGEGEGGADWRRRGDGLRSLIHQKALLCGDELTGFSWAHAAPMMLRLDPPGHVCETETGGRRHNRRRQRLTEDKKHRFSLLLFSCCAGREDDLLLTAASPSFIYSGFIFYSSSSVCSYGTRCSDQPETFWQHEVSLKCWGS